MQSPRSAWVAVLLLPAACATAPGEHKQGRPTTGVIGVQESQLDSGHWIRRQRGADRVLLIARDIAAQNQRLREHDPSVHDLEHFPKQLSGQLIRQWIENLAGGRSHPLFDAEGNEVSPSAFEELSASLDLGKLPPLSPARYGLAVRRADLRTYPTRARIFSSRGDTDIDRFQESALFVGTPVVIAHESLDHAWWFVVSPSYAAWVEKECIAEGTLEQVAGYIHKTPYLIVTGAKERTVFTPERPEVSELQLDMGVRIPLLTDQSPERPVNGQHPYESHIVELPIRAPNGSLRFTPALLPKTSDVAMDYLPMSPANLLRQAFKFLGERYGWGHSYNARDCSGFVSDVYRSFGVELPRNTRDQAVSPVLDRLTFPASGPSEQRLAALRDLEVGDLIYIPSHVMMVIGHENGMPYVIHDTTGISYRGEDERIVRLPLNGVSVTPLTPLLAGSGEPTVDHIYSILRIHPRDKS